MNCPASFARHASSRRFFSERQAPVEGNSNHHHAAGRFPLPTTEEWGEGKGEGIPISRANSMEGAPLPVRASQGEGAGGFHDGGTIQMRPRAQLGTATISSHVCKISEDPHPVPIRWG